MLQREITYREREVQELRHKIKEKEMQADAALVSDQLNRHNVAKLKGESDLKDQQILELQEKLAECQRALDQMTMQRKNEGSALLQNEHYKLDNERLIKLLGATEQYSNFAEIATDSGANIRCLDNKRAPVAKPKGNPTGKSQKNGTKTKDFKAGEEFEDWIPEEAFKIAHDFRNKCASQIQVSLMNQFLTDLNKVWRAREQRQISRIKAECNREVQFLRRQLQFQKPYDKVMHQTEVKRLRDDLKSAKATLRENVAVIKQDQQAPNTDGLIVIDQTLKYTNQIQMERRKLHEEKEALQLEIEQMKTTKKDEKVEKEKFYEGAAWLGKQTLQVAESGLTQGEHLRLQYHKKVADAAGDEFLRGRAVEWLLDSTVRLTQQVRDENQRLMETALRNGTR